LWTQELPFQRIEHQVATVDAQPSNESGGILVVVSGALLVSLRLREEKELEKQYWQNTAQVEEERRPMSYTQTFQLLPADGAYYVFNDVFRLVYPAA
jgi:hypothetical protein